MSAPEVPPGEKVSLRWHWNVATNGYLSSIGRIDSASGGTAIVAPTETSSYVLVLEAPGLPPRVLSLRILVPGAKGSASVWPTDLFVPLTFQNDYSLNATSLATVAAKVRDVLQNRRGFELRQFSPSDGQIVIATAYMQRQELNNSDETPKEFRRIAFRISLVAGTVPRSVHVNISATIEWRVPIDDRWFPEDSSSSIRYRIQMNDLRKETLGN